MVEKSVVKNIFVEYIDNIIKNNRVSHAYIVEVNNYDDDLSYVLAFIKMILCNLSYHDVIKSSNPIIQQIDHNNYPDIRIVSSEANVINKSLISDLQKDYSNKSFLDSKRIYIIKEAEKLNNFSSNTILKFLEEPEDDIIAFLLTDSRYHILDTIQSRCQILSLKEDLITSDFSIDIFDYLDLIINPFNYFIKNNYCFNTLFVDKNVLKQHLLEIENVLLSYLENNKSVNGDMYNYLSTLDTNRIIIILSILEDELPKLSYNVNFKLWCDSMFSKLIGGFCND